MQRNVHGEEDIDMHSIDDYNIMNWRILREEINYHARLVNEIQEPVRDYASIDLKKAKRFRNEIDANMQQKLSSPQCLASLNIFRKIVLVDLDEYPLILFLQHALPNDVLVLGFLKYRNDTWERYLRLIRDDKANQRLKIVVIYDSSNDSFIPQTYKKLNQSLHWDVKFIVVSELCELFQGDTVRIRNRRLVKCVSLNELKAKRGFVDDLVF